MSDEFDPTVDARIGDFKFKPEFSDPDVILSHDRDTNNHEIVTGHTAYRDQGIEYVVQAMGRNAPTIEITGWVTKEQLDQVDDLLSAPRIQLTTGRWSGIAVPLSIDVDYSRVFHDEHGWIYETEFELRGTEKDGSLRLKRETTGADRNVSRTRRRETTDGVV